MQPSSTTGLPDAGMTAQGLADPAGDEIDLRELLGILLAGKWTVILVTGVAVFLGVRYVLSSSPVYQANALVQVETRGSSSLLDELQNLSALAGQESPGQTEIQILKSRYVSGQVVDHLVLDIEVEPRRFGVLGRTLATDQARAGELAEPWLGLDRYAWGGEILTVKRMKVPDQWLGKPLKLIALGGGQFKLRDPEGNALLTGRAGELATLGKAGNADSRVEIFVQELVARPGTEFMVTRKSRLKTIETLRERLAISEQGKGTGILQLSLEGENPAEIAGILNDIARTYLRQNVERRSAQAEESLRFLDDQLPKLKAELESAEEAFNAFRKKNESLDLSVETQGLLRRIVEVETEISNLQLKRTQMGQSFASQHPTMIGIGNQISELTSVKRELESRAGNLPDTQQEILRLQREVEVKNALYTGLLNKAQELRIIRAGTLGNVRIIDEAAIPEQPIKPRKSLIVLLSLLLGLFAGVVAVFLQRSLRRGVVDSRQLETELGLTVYASVPYSGKNRRLVREATRAGDTRMPVLAREAPQQVHGEVGDDDVVAAHVGGGDVGHGARDHVGRAVAHDVVAGGVHGVLVVVEGQHGPRPEATGRDGQHARPRADVGHRAPGHREPFQRPQAEARGLVVPGAEAHRGLDEDEHLAGRRDRNVPGRGDHEAPGAHGAEFLLHLHGPALVFDVGGREVERGTEEPSEFGERLRRTAVRHHGHRYAGHGPQHLATNLRRTGTKTDVQLTRLRASERDQLRHVRCRHRRMHGDDEMRGGSHGQRREIAHRIEGQLCVQSDVGGHGRVRADHQRVPIRRRLRRRLHANDPARARPIFDHDLLAETFGEPLRNEAGQNIGAASSALGHDHAQRPIGVSLGLHKRRTEQQQAGDAANETRPPLQP